MRVVRRFQQQETGQIESNDSWSVVQRDKAVEEAVRTKKRIEELSQSVYGSYQDSINTIELLIGFQKIGCPSKQYDQMVLSYESRIINGIENDIKRSRREEQERQKQQAREKRKQRWQANKAARGTAFRKMLLIAALAWLFYVTYSTLHYTKTMNYWGNFEDWVENAGIRLAVSLGLMGIACGINFNKGFEVDYHIGLWIAAYVAYAVVYTVIWIKYTSDWTAIIAFPIVFFGLCGCVVFITWLCSKIFK